MPSMVFGKDYTHDFEKKIYDISSLEDYKRVMNIMKDPYLRSVLYTIAHRPKSLADISRITGKSKMRTQMMIDEIEKHDFLIVTQHTHGKSIIDKYQAKYNVFMFDMR